MYGHIHCCGLIASFCISSLNTKKVYRISYARVKLRTLPLKVNFQLPLVIMKGLSMYVAASKILNNHKSFPCIISFSVEPQSSPYTMYLAILWVFWRASLAIYITILCHYTPLLYKITVYSVHMCVCMYNHRIVYCIHTYFTASISFSMINSISFLTVQLQEQLTSSGQ